MKAKKQHRKLLLKISLSIIILLSLITIKKVDTTYTNETIRIVKKTLNYEFKINDKKIKEFKKVVATFSTVNTTNNYSIPIQGTLYKKYSEDNEGIDIIAYEEYVKSIAEGKVVNVTKKSTGIDVKIVHDEITSVYSKMEKVNVKKGEKVLKGHIVGSMGDVSSKNKKLHFQIWKNDKATNPLEYIEVNDKKPLSYK